MSTWKSLDLVTAYATTLLAQEHNQPVSAFLPLFLHTDYEAATKKYLGIVVFLKQRH